MYCGNSKKQKYWIIVIELDDVVPRRDPQKPNLYVAKTVTPPDSRFGTIQRSKKPHWYSKHVVGLRQDLSSNATHSSSESASKACKQLIQKLMREGYTVNRNTQVWTVYVIELDETAVSNPGKGYVYVGETSKTPEVRFNQHRNGVRNKHGRLFAGVVRQHGVKLRPDLAPRKAFFDKASAKRGEREHFQLLKKKGYNVRGGH